MARSCTAKDLCLQKHTSNSRTQYKVTQPCALVDPQATLLQRRTSVRPATEHGIIQRHVHISTRMYIQLDRPRLLAARCLFSNSCTLLSACVLSLDLSTRKSMRDSSYQRFCLFTTAILSQGIIYRLGRNENLVNSKRIKLACTDY